MCTDVQAAAYLAAMIDGEGWIGAAKGPQNRAVRIANTDPDLIAAIREACDVLGIHYTVQQIKRRKAHWADGWMVDITGHRSLSIIYDRVPIRAKRKLDRLEQQVASFRNPPLDPDRLRELYTSGLTQAQVAEALGVGKKRVITAMQIHGIQRRGATERADSIWRERRKLHGPTGRKP